MVNVKPLILMLEDEVERLERFANVLGNQAHVEFRHWRTADSSLIAPRSKQYGEILRELRAVLIAERSTTKLSECWCGWECTVDELLPWENKNVALQSQ